jgi:hypothetical protein
MVKRWIEIIRIEFGRRERILFALLVLVWEAFGLVFDAVILGSGAVAALALGVRIWWPRRRLRCASASAYVSVIDGQYALVDEDRQRKRGDSHA